jgi:hypothetical protein
MFYPMQNVYVMLSHILSLRAKRSNLIRSVVRSLLWLSLPTVRLGEVLTKSDESVDFKPDVTYREVSMS